MASPASNVKFLAVSFALPALGTAKTRGVACPVDGYVRQIQYQSDVACDDANVLTGAISGTAITGGTITLGASTTVAGMVQACVPTAAHRCLRGQALTMATDGGGTVGDGVVTFLIEQD